MNYSEQTIREPGAKSHIKWNNPDGPLLICKDGTVRRWLCAVGLHKYELRELHAEEPVQRGRPEMLMCIIERCVCGHSRIAPGGRRMITRTGLVVPSNYKPGEDAKQQI